MSDNEERCAIKFCFRLGQRIEPSGTGIELVTRQATIRYLYHSATAATGHNGTEAFEKLQQAYGDSVLSRAQVFRRFKAFSEGRESIEDEPRSGRPSVSKTAENVVRVRDLVRSDRRLTVRMIGEELNLNHTTVHQFLTNELKMRKI
ncbi:HTH_48 domain-containing protein [Trichonephila clavipes]|nr:HTH_48 domain-containing protein [Trichonephila clavipes]